MCKPQRMHHLVAIREVLQIRPIFRVRLGRADALQRKKFYSQNLRLLNRLHYLYLRVRFMSFAIHYVDSSLFADELLDARIRKINGLVLRVRVELGCGDGLR